MTRPSAPLLIACVATALIVGCGGSRSKPAGTAPGSAQPPRVYAGEVGVLPTPRRATKGRPSLVVPLDALTVPGAVPA